jgi:hypothetical protein
MDVLQRIMLLGDDETNNIFSYICPPTLSLLTKPLYIEHHHTMLIKTLHRDYSAFIRDALRNKRDFIFKYIAKEHFDTWNTWRLYRFQNSIYNNYVSYILQFCIDTNSQKCRQIVLDAKNNMNNADREKQHKNVRTKHTIWKK